MTGRKLLKFFFDALHVLCDSLYLSKTREHLSYFQKIRTSRYPDGSYDITAFWDKSKFQREPLTDCDVCVL